MATPDNLDQDQRRGDHLTVALSFAAILLVHILVPILFKEYAHSYGNTVFCIGVAVLLIGFFIMAEKLWTMTFETYNGWYVAGPVLMAVASIIWFMSWGAVYGTAVENGFIK